MYVIIYNNYLKIKISFIKKEIQYTFISLQHLAII